MKSFILVLFCLVSNFTFAQYSYTSAKIYLKKGIVMTGEAKLRMPNGRAVIPQGEEFISFKTKESTKEINLKSVDSVVFNVTIKTKKNRKKVTYTERQKFIPIYLKEKKEHLRMVRPLTNTDIILYARSVKDAPGYGPLKHFLVARNQNEIPTTLVPYSPRRFRKEASNFFKDCNALVKKIESKEYEREDIIEIVRFYNSKCTK